MQGRETRPGNDEPGVRPGATDSVARAVLARAGLAPKVLIVDHSAATRSFIRVYLSFRDCELLEADTGEKALSILKITPVDLVIADTAASGADGLELVRSLRSHRQARLQTLPVILLTADRAASAERRAVEAGANRVLRKPIDANKLRQLVESLLVASEPEARPSSPP